MKVFWPTRGIELTHGDVVGWKIDDTLCVVGIVQDWLASDGDDELRGLERVGTATTISDTSSGPSSTSVNPVLWLDEKQHIPRASSQPIQVILYTPPDTKRLRFLQLSPDRMDSRAHQRQENQKGLKAQYGASGMETQDGYGSSARMVRKRKLDTIDKVIELINRTSAAQRTISARAPIITRTGSTGSFATVRHSPTGVSDSSVALILSATAKLARSFINAVSMPSTYLPPIRSLSSTVDQLCLRLAQALITPQRFKSTREVTSIQERSKRYISRLLSTRVDLYSSTQNDVILGYSARQLILISAESIHRNAIQTFSTHLVESPIHILHWLNDWPVGLKLNTPLSQFFCTSLGVVIGLWGAHIDPLLRTYGPTLIQTIAWISFGGLTFTLAIINDLLSLLAIHLHVCHILMRAIYRWQLDSLGGLWNLFRGKRWNVLRQRTDSYAYDVDQLFLGTLLFTVSAFLFPTVLTYAALFAAIRMVSLTANAAMAYAIDALNAFPLFELLLRIKEPSRLPAGVHFKLQRLHPKPSPDAVGVGNCIITHVLELKNSPKSFADIMRPSPTSGI
ncbi:hypothetical protein I317_02080 [Kwoniella heveanensis CBS 569]|nr:hypothetical protein I317_02080 [Kwoniella heveanensis CBS 569]